MIVLSKSDPILGFQWLGIEEIPEQVSRKKAFVYRGSFKGSSRRRNENNSVKSRQRQRDSRKIYEKHIAEN